MPRRSWQIADAASRLDLLMPIVSLIGATCTLEELILLPNTSDEKCSTSIDLGAPRAMSNVFHPQPNLYQKKKQPEQGYNDKLYEQNILYSMLVSKALSVMNGYVFKQKKNIVDEDVEEILLGYYPVALEELGLNSNMISGYDAHMDGERPATMTNWDYAERQCHNAVQSARMYWNPEVYPDIQRRAREQGARGGRAYKAYDLGMHLSTAHIKNVSEVARLLGVARGTVYAMRREYEDIDLTTGELNGKEETTHRTEPMESDRLGAETRKSNGCFVGELDESHTRASSSPDPYASRSSEVDGGAVRILHDLEALTLPF